MGLKDDIASLRAEVNQLSRPTADRSAKKEPPAEFGELGNDHKHEVEALVSTLNSVMDEFSEDLEKHPKLAAIAALGIGLALGVVIGRQLR